MPCRLELFQGAGDGCGAVRCESHKDFPVLAGGLLAIPLAGVSAEDRPFDSVSRPARSAASHSPVLSAADQRPRSSGRSRAGFFGEPPGRRRRLPHGRKCAGGRDQPVRHGLFSRSHQPGAGRYGPKLVRAIDFVLAAQDPASGAITGERFSRRARLPTITLTDTRGLMLAEVYGADAKRNGREFPPGRHQSTRLQPPGSSGSRSGPTSREAGAV